MSIEFLVVGGATLVLLPIAWFYRMSVGLDSSEFMVSFFAFHAAYVINDPHFAVTYLLFYKDVKQRALGAAFSPLQRLRYIVAGFAAALVLVAWAGAALAGDSARTMDLLIQLMFFLVGWHYVKQGFGAALGLCFCVDGGPPRPEQVPRALNTPRPTAPASARRTAPRTRKTPEYR